MTNNSSRAHIGINDADKTSHWVFFSSNLIGLSAIGLEPWYRRVVQGQMLLSNQTGAYAGAQMAIKKVGDFCGRNVLSRFKQASGESRNGFGVCFDEIAHYLSKLVGRVPVGDLALSPWKKGGKAVQIILMDLGHIWVGDDYERQIAQSTDALGETGGQYGESEVCRIVQGLGREGRTAMLDKIVEGEAMAMFGSQRLDICLCDGGSMETVTLCPPSRVPGVMDSGPWCCLSE